MSPSSFTNPATVPAAHTSTEQHRADIADLVTGLAIFAWLSNGGPERPGGVR